jgi:hypothetical protein
VLFLIGFFKDPHGGVLIAAKNQRQRGNITKSKDIELITGKVDVEYSDLFLMGWFGFCRFW